MRRFKATAVNDAGDRFQFWFQNANWNGVEQAANDALYAVVAGDQLHRRNGPWRATEIDVSA